MNAARVRLMSLAVVIAGLAVTGLGVDRACAGVFDPDVYNRGENMRGYMRSVAGGGQPGGPAYTFSMSRYEITNGQYAAFLNDAQLDGGATGRGSNMVFEDSGRVRVSQGGPTVFLSAPASFSQIDYDPLAPIGQRFSVLTENGVSLDHFPVMRVSWFGAAKFANWLTIDQGLGESQRAYTEGPNPEDWHPVSITTTDWQTRGLNSTERQNLVDNVKGFRMPMDDRASTASAFNEFYKAAAWDVDDQVNRTYGFGRDTIDHMDANGDDLDPSDIFGLFPDNPFEAGVDPETTPVGFYDGTLWQRGDWNWPDQTAMFDTFLTRANENSYGIFDLSGNVREWIQDSWMDGTGERTFRGGDWGTGPFRLDVSVREPALPSGTSNAVGFRLVQVPEPSYLMISLFTAFFIFRRNR